MIERHHSDIPVCRQCELLSLPRSTFYYEPCRDEAYNEHLMRLIDEEYTRHPFRGAPSITRWLKMDMGEPVNHKRVERLMRRMGLASVQPGPHTSKPHPEHRIYPYLLRNVDIRDPNQVWCADITYIRLAAGFVYLVAIMDWASRYVLAWELSNTLDAAFCLSALERALQRAKPLVFNTDQGAQFTSTAWTNLLLAWRILISMDGRGRVFDNIFIERLWRSLKYEEVYLHDYDGVKAARAGISNWFDFYDHERRHSALDYRTPAEVYHG